MGGNRYIKNDSMQGCIWLLTIPWSQFTPYLPPGCSYIKGQLECGEGGFLHWQVLVHTARSRRLRWMRRTFGPHHVELSRSAAADDYVWKEATAVVGTRFELGSKPVRRNSATDWDEVWNSAVAGELLAIPSDVRIRCYSTLKKIRGDMLQPMAIERSCVVFWGETGVGKSRRAWEEAGLEAYPKDPRTKFWCGYHGQEHVVLDEFRGGIDIAHVLRWLDRYPVRVEVKGGSFPLLVKRYWVTSNLHPSDWYPEIDPATRDALLRRLEIIKIT